LLADSEKVFLRQLSVFAGGWTLDSAQSVCDGNALNLTNSLAQKSLIMVEQVLEHETRYHFHETLRQYAYEKLVESGEEEAIRIRHLSYFLRLSEKIESGLRGIEQGEWFARAIFERDNLFAALEQASKLDIEAGLYISSRLEAVWERYDVRMGVFWLDEFLQCPESKQYSLARARALCAQSWLLVWLEQIAQARGAVEESLALFIACNDQPGKTDALTLLGVTHFFLGDKAEGVKLYQQALALSQTLGDTWRQAKVSYFLGWDHSDIQRAFEYWDKAAALFSEVGDRRSQADILCWVSLFRVLNGDIELAQKYLDEAAILIPFDRNIDIWIDFQVTESTIAIALGDFERAHTLLQKVLVYAEKLGNRFEYLWAKARTGHLALRQQKFREARDVFTETAQEFQKNEETMGVVYTLEGLAGLFIAIGNPKNAAQLIGLSDAMRKATNDPRPLLEQSDVDKVIAACLSKMGEVAFAEAYDEGQVMTIDEAVALALNQL
jgi:tetratricopeptide (TPR) repeat protein